MLLSKDPYRPELHFTAPFGWLNDPNGLVYVNGEWHLFYQYYPHSNQWGDMHWGHAVSHNFLEWKHLPIALKPNELGVCFSGSAVIDKNNVTGFFDEGDLNLVAFYTNTIGLSSNQPDGLQMSSIASSKDGISFDQHLAINPIIPNSGSKHFRDPKVVWHEEAQHWNMVVTEGEEIGIYSSINLKQWKKESNWGRHESFHNNSPWECPDLFPMIDDQGVKRWVLVIGIIERNVYTPGSGTHYVIGDFDGKTFSNINPADTVLWMDYGRDFYATQSWSNTPDNRCVAIAWMSNWMYANEVPATSHRSAMSFPRELSLVTTAQGLRIAQAFPCEGLVQNKNYINETKLQLNQSVELSPSNQASVMHMTLNMSEGSAFTLAPFTHNNLVYHFKRQSDDIVISSVRKTDVAGSSRFNQDFPHENCFVVRASDQLTLSIVRDRTSFELLVSDGLYSSTESMFNQDFGPFNITATEGFINIISFNELVKEVL
ncbi:glycoside hydrolase family 32 protein [Alginatibacterium sediminis]|uniref:Glycoside hydrolase family 32 protein n=1 Tax=Alginatibacterium sediminis TaxID=2164068 RepID=A0A420EBA9_9ALTE|nr:glycoside hydrolase family 32 protein [Alginatibacterium sediminis]RKF17961.1 glycoside hydrolase family 32 protein [Alginatibacterium sediminis]